MAILKLNSQIVDDASKVWMDWNGMSGISFEDVKGFIAAIPEEDNTIDIRINCAGGDCVEGWAMYDALRQSGKTITATIEGQCSSMATAILLAAPKENRKAYPNAHLCAHNPEACYVDVDQYNRLTADNLDAMAEKVRLQAESLRVEQQKILDLYVERTGSEASVLQALMNEDIYINMQRAKELGFIGDILVPNTALKTKNNIFTMNKDNKSQGAIAKAFAALGAALGIEQPAAMKALTISTPAGDELVVEREEGEPQVGDAASPDGTFVLEDGSTIVVEDGVIKSITPAAQEEAPAEGEEAKKKTCALTDPSTGEEIDEEAAQALINELAAKVADLEAKLAETEQAGEEAKAQAMNDEQKAICARVAENGGVAWLDKVMKMQSNGFNPQAKQNDFHAGEQSDKIGDSFIASTSKRVFRR